MSTPMLSKKQQKKALSGKKAPAKGLRNVLAQPYGFSWPTLKNDNVEELKLLLKTSMPAIKRLSPHISWVNLHKMTKSERKAARNDARLAQGISSPDKNITNGIVMGVNAVTRLLEKNNASCVLLEAGVEPMLLIKHIVRMADLKNVPVILVPFLKTVTLETVGFACAAVALKMTVAEAENHHFHNLYKKVVELTANFERTRPSKLDYEDNTGNGSSLEETVIIEEKSCGKHEVQNKKLLTLSTEIYKYRNSKNQRVFIPEAALESENVTQRLDSDFISVSSDLGFVRDDSRQVKHKRKCRYVDIHTEDRENFLETKNNSMQLDNYLSLDPIGEYSGSPSDKIGFTDSLVCHETRSKVVGITDQSSLDLEDNIPSRKKKTHNKKVKYESLKVKRLQGNSNRIKATKVAKRNKK